jgi:hypothetical protein
MAAAAFVKYFFESLDRAYQQGAPLPTSLASPQCNSCANFAGVARDLARQGHRFDGPSFTELDAQAPPVDHGQVFVTLTCQLPARREVDGSGDLVKAYKSEGRLVLTVLVQRAGSGWSIRAMRTEKS